MKDWVLRVLGGSWGVFFQIQKFREVFALGGFSGILEVFIERWQFGLRGWR